jgi:hypothetical protein
MPGHVAHFGRHDAPPEHRTKRAPKGAAGQRPHGRARESMPATSVLLNLLWIIFGGVWMAAGWLLAAVIMAITIIGLAWARAALTIAIYTLLPFGHTVIDRRSGAIGGTLGFIGNLIWLVLAGWWLAFGHLARSRRHDHRDSVRRGAFQTCRDFALASRQRSNKHRRGAARAAMVRSKRRPRSLQPHRENGADTMAAVPSFGPRMRCSHAPKLGTTAGAQSD